MKKFLFLLLIMSAIHVSAQDVIVMKDGSTIVSKVLEITSSEVKYKKFTNLEGPTYAVLKSDIQVINYANGEKETFGTEQDAREGNALDQEVQADKNGVNNQFQNVSYEQLAGMRAPVYNIKDVNKKIKRLRLAGWIGGGIMMAGGIAGTLAFIGDDDLLDGLIIIGVPLVGAGAIWTMAFNIRANKLKRRSELSLNSMPLYQYDLKFNNGSSLAAGIDVLRDSRFHDQTLGVGLRYNF